MTPGSTRTTWKPSANRWPDVHRLHHDLQRVGFKNPKWRSCRSPFSTTMASFTRNLFLRVNSFVPPPSTSKFWNDCCSASVAFGQTCTWLDRGCCCTTTRRLTLRFVCQILAHRGVIVVDHPPYSPDLTPADIFLFPCLKTALNGTRFDDLDDIQGSVTTTLKTIFTEAFSESFQNLFDRFQRCIERDKGYFEDQKKSFFHSVTFHWFLTTFTELFGHTLYM